MEFKMNHMKISQNFGFILILLWLITLKVTLIEAGAMGKRWAVLVAGSKGYSNYRHQANVCHAYQVLKKGGLCDENIIVFMYDDIAFNSENPRPGVLINKPQGSDVYGGVPKDYTGDQVNAENFYAVILGNRSAVSGGSGKVVDSGPDDSIFIYYSDHGFTGMIGMPVGDNVLANDFIDVLKKKHAANAYKRMVIYVEACESGSIFEGLLPKDINIYATTSANATESSFGVYCPDDYPDAPPEYTVCLGDLYSVSWMEDSDKHDMGKETLGQQYEWVRRRTAHSTDAGSHVMQYGNMSMRKDLMVTYIGKDPANENYTFSFIPANASFSYKSQSDAHLLHLRHKIRRASNGSIEKEEAEKEYYDEILKRKLEDNNIRRIKEILFGDQENRSAHDSRPKGQSLVNDWDCFKALLKTYQKQCGSLSRYGLMKYSRAIANMCNAGIAVHQMTAALSQTCPGKNHAS